MDNEPLFSPREPDHLPFTDASFFDVNINGILDPLDEYNCAFAEDGYEVEPNELLATSTEAILPTGLLPITDNSPGFTNHRLLSDPLAIESQQPHRNKGAPSTVSTSARSEESARNGYDLVISPASIPPLSSSSTIVVSGTSSHHTKPNLKTGTENSSTGGPSSAMASNSIPLSTFIGAFDNVSPTMSTAVSTSHQPFLHHLESQPVSHDKLHENAALSQSVSPPSSSQSQEMAESELERQRRLAAEEDKRRRNTAASARFRIKKKLRDQEMERRAREQAQRVTELEKKIAQLELENKWLRNLLVEKKLS